MINRRRPFARGAFIAVVSLLLQVRHRRGLFQLLLLDDDPIGVRRRRRRPGYRGGRYEPVQSGQPVTHRARNRGSNESQGRQRLRHERRNPARPETRKLGDSVTAPSNPAVTIICDTHYAI